MKNVLVPNHILSLEGFCKYVFEKCSFLVVPKDSLNLDQFVKRHYFRYFVFCQDLFLSKLDLLEYNIVFKSFFADFSGKYFIFALEY